MNPIIFLTLCLLGAATISMTIINTVYIGYVNSNVNSLTDKLFPADSCVNCPLACTTPADCPNVFFSIQYNATVTCPINRCIYDVVPLTPLVIPVGRVTDLLCQNIVVPLHVNCLSMKSLGDCNGIFTGCVGSFPCQFG